MVKTIQPSRMIVDGAGDDAPEYDLGLMQVEPMFDADPDEFDDDVLDDDDDDDGFDDDDDDDDDLEDELEADDLDDDGDV